MVGLRGGSGRLLGSGALTTPSLSMEQLSDAQAVRAVLAGRTEAYAVLVRRYQDVLFAHAARMVGGRDEAADLVQRALVRGYRRLASCREPGRVGEPGFHHFGFLVDGEWWIPEGVQGAVPDEWGRVNATMVVPDQEREP